MFANPFWPYPPSSQPASRDAGTTPASAFPAFPEAGVAPALELWMEASKDAARLYMEALAGLSHSGNPVDAVGVVSKYMQQSSQLTLNTVKRAHEMMLENASMLEAQSAPSFDIFPYDERRTAA